MVFRMGIDDRVWASTKMFVALPSFISRSWTVRLSHPRVSRSKDRRRLGRGVGVLSSPLSIETRCCLRRSIGADLELVCVLLLRSPSNLSMGACVQATDPQARRAERAQDARKLLWIDAESAPVSSRGCMRCLHKLLALSCCLRSLAISCPACRAYMQAVRGFSPQAYSAVNHAGEPTPFLTQRLTFRQNVSVPIGLSQRAGRDGLMAGSSRPHRRFVWSSRSRVRCDGGLSHSHIATSSIDAGVGQVAYQGRCLMCAARVLG